MPNKSPIKHIKIADDEHKTKFTENVYYDMEGPIAAAEGTAAGSQHLKKFKNNQIDRNQ